jgi:hypothetical protein
MDSGQCCDRASKLTSPILLCPPRCDCGPKLIGCQLVKCQLGGELLWGVVVKTEAYCQVKFGIPVQGVGTHGRRTTDLITHRLAHKDTQLRTQTTSETRQQRWHNPAAVMGDPGLLQELPDITPLLAQGCGDGEQAAAADRFLAGLVMSNTINKRLRLAQTATNWSQRRPKERLARWSRQLRAPCHRGCTIQPCPASSG